MGKNCIALFTICLTEPLDFTLLFFHISIMFITSCSSPCHRSVCTCVTLFIHHFHLHLPFHSFSLIYWFIRSFVRSFVRSFIHSFILSCILFNHPLFPNSLIHLFTRIFAQSFWDTYNPIFITGTVSRHLIVVRKYLIFKSQLIDQFSLLKTCLLLK